LLTLLPLEVEKILLHLAKKLPPSEEMLCTLAQAAPIFFGFYRCLRNKIETNQQLWEVFLKGLVDVFVIFDSLRKAKDSAALQDLTSSEAQQLYAHMQHSECPNPDLQELWHTGCYFPGFPIIRKVSKQTMSGTKEGKCTKHARNISKLGPGIVLFFCLEHSKCIGFIVQKEPESLTMVFEAIVTRFKIMPKTIIYDNGCNLYEYIQNRLPQLFSKTQVLVDSFHYHSHTACAPTFDSNQNFVAKSFNSSLCEQKNKKIKKAKPTTPFMRYRTFAAFLRFMVYRLNDDKETLRTEENTG
jgi:hypothetical protein